MPLELHLEAHRDYLLVRQSGALDDTTADEMQLRVQAAADQHHVRRVILDNRLTLAAAPEVRGKMHAWVTTPGRFERTAMVLESEMLVIGINMDALSRGLKLKAFSDLEQAVAWIGQGA